MFPDATFAHLQDIIPKDADAWGKIQWLNGGDMMHAREVMGPGTVGRDMSYIKVSLSAPCIHYALSPCLSTLFWSIDTPARSMSPLYSMSVHSTDNYNPFSRSQSLAPTQFSGRTKPNRTF